MYIGQREREERWRESKRNKVNAIQTWCSKLRGKKEYVVNVTETRGGTLKMLDKCKKNVQILGNKEQEEEQIVR
jgi:hypothetical protein